MLSAVSPLLRKRGGGHRRLAKRERKAPQAKPRQGGGLFIVNQCRPAQVNLRAARRLAERERTAPHAKLLSRRGFMGQRPQLRVHTSKLYGKMMRRLIDTECRQVCELQHTQTVHRELSC